MATEPYLHTGIGIKRGDAARTASAGRVTYVADFFRRQWVKTWLFFAADLAAVFAAYHLSRIGPWGGGTASRALLNLSDFSLFYALLLTALLYLFKGYRNAALRRPEKELELVVKCVSFSLTALVGANYLLFKLPGFPGYAVVKSCFLTLVFLLAARFGLRAAYAALWRRGLARQKTLLIGTTAQAAAFLRRLSIQRYQGCELVGVLAELDSDRVPGAEQHSLPVLGSIENWEAISDSVGASLVVIHLDALAADHGPRAHQILRRCQEKGIEVAVYSTLFGGAELRGECDGYSCCLRQRSPRQWSLAMQRLAKTFLDILIGNFIAAIGR